MLASDVPAARSMCTCYFGQQCAHSQQSSSASSGGLPVGMRLPSSHLADVHPAPVVGGECLTVHQITSMAQIAPIVFEELLSLASLRLGRFTAVSDVVNSSSSSSCFGMARVKP